MACVEKPTETYDRALSFCLQFGVRERLVERDGGGCSFRWTSDIHTGFCQQDLEDIYIYITPSNDMPDLEDLPFGNMICFISCCLAVFFLEWFFFFLAMKNLTIAN